MPLVVRVSRLNHHAHSHVNTPYLTAQTPPPYPPPDTFLISLRLLGLCIFGPSMFPL